MSRFIYSKNLGYKDLENAFSETENGDSLIIVGLWGGRIVYKKNNKGAWVKEGSKTQLPKMYKQDCLVSALYENMTGANAYNTVKLYRKCNIGYYTSLEIKRG